MFRKHAWLLLLACSLCPASLSAQIISPNRVFGRYQAFNWQEQHGVPQSTVLAVTTTRDGYVWLGTYEGAARFDGLRFTLFSPTNTDAIGSPMVQALLEDRAGDLWLGTYGGGVSRLSGGRFTRYTTRDGLASDYITRLFEDRNGTLWVGTDGGGVSRWHDGRFTSHGVAEGLPGANVRDFAQDAEGGLWVGTNRGIVRMIGDRVSAADLPTTLTTMDTTALGVTRDGALWAGARGGRLHRFANRHLTTFGPAQGVPASRIESIFEDRERRLWIGTAGAGLLQFAAGRVEPQSSTDGLGVDRVVAISQGLANDLWLGSDNGLFRLTEPRVRVYTQRDGLSDDHFASIYQDDAGDVWIGTRTGLNRVHNGVFRTLTTKDGLPGDGIRHVAPSTDGGLWVNTNSGLARMKDLRIVSTMSTIGGVESSRITSLLQDRRGDLWLGIEDGGAMRVRGETITRFTTRDGLGDNTVVTLFEDRAGSVWIGTLRGGMTRVQGETLTFWSSRDGLPDDHVKSFYEDRDGTLWVGTHGGGLSRFKDGRFATISSRQGLYNDIVFAILDDDDGNVWMSCNKGIWSTSLSELNDVADGRRATVTSFAYGVADGMLSSEGIGASRSSWRMHDGTLWFATVRGVVVVDPRKRGTEPPRVVVESATIDRDARPIDSALRVEPHQENVEIHYTALSWNRPHEMRFRYRLDGLDREWIDAGTRRIAYYSHLPAGNYVFEVTADNGEGVWSAEPQRLLLTVLPPFYRTWWFESIMALTAVSAVVLVWRYRMLALRRAHATQQAFARELIASQEQERKRIAAELHDGLGQRLVVIHNLAMMCAQASEHNGSSHRLETIASQTHGAIDEIRDISYNLRPYHLDTLGLTKALESIVKTTASATPAMTLTHDIDDVDGVFPGDAAINVYRIVQESLNNIVKHSAARAASVTVRHEARRLTVTIRDDGAGFAPGGKRHEARRGGFGLVGIRERASLLGGRAAIHSVPGQGTTVTVDIPLQ
jgi:signal transduction histidine kinase/ligand-binding sensor domain-containing protein